MDSKMEQRIDIDTYPLILRALLYIFSFQKAAVGSNFLLKLALYVKEDIIFVALVFCIGPNLHQLALEEVKLCLDYGQVATITSIGLL